MTDQGDERLSGKSFGAFLKRQRELRGMTQTEVALAAGKKQSQISKLEDGLRQTITRSDIAIISRAVKSSERAALRALGYMSSLDDIEGDEEARAIAESFASYETPEAREVLRAALRYADAIETGLSRSAANG